MKANVLRRKEAGEKAWLWGLEALLHAHGLPFQVPDTLLSGWLSRKPTALKTDSQGSLNILHSVPSDFVTSFMCVQPQKEGYPMCIVRQNGTGLLTDTLAVTSMWHKSLSSGRNVFIQRYVTQPEVSSSLVRVIWKMDSVRLIRITNKVPYHGRRLSSFSLLAKAGTPYEERFLTRPDNATLSEVVDSVLTEQVRTLIDLLKRHVPEPKQLSEVTAEFNQGIDLKWNFLRVVSYELSRTVRTTKAFRPVSRKQRASTAPQKGKMSIKRLSQAILSIKQVMGLEITSGDRKRVSEHSDFSRFAPRSSVPLQKKFISKSDASLANLEPNRSSVDMPPIFQFPTPRETEELNVTAGPERFKEIHDHIKRQNNSLFMRIHFQEELPQERMLKELVKQSVDSIAIEFDRLRALGSRGRKTLTNLKDTL